MDGIRQKTTVFLAKFKGRRVGYLIAISDPDRSHYWDVSVHPEVRDLGVGHLLMWAWIRHSARRGVTTLDLIGPPEGGRAGRRAGIGRFKQSFGAEPVPYWVAYWRSPLAAIALKASRFLDRYPKLVDHSRHFRRPDRDSPS